MAYVSSGLSRIGSGGGYAVWIYASEDNLAAVNNSGYFTGEAVNMLNAGDVVMVVDTNASPIALSATVVVSNDGTTVDCGTGLDLSTADAD